jgi:hypothetical protein
MCPKPSFDAYRLPVWLPMSSIPAGRATEVWGNARPSYFAQIDTGQPQNVLIQWAPGTTGQFRTVTTAQTSANGFFDTRVKFPGAGQVRLAWAYPAGDFSLRDPLDPSPWIYSRVTSITFYKHKASGYLRGVFKGQTKLGLTVKKGANAPLITSVSVRPPRGVKFKCLPIKKGKLKHRSCTGLEVRGGKIKLARVAHGTFVLGLVKPVSTASITAGAPFVHASLKKGKRVTFKLLVVDTNGASSTIRLKLKPK